MFQLTDQHLCNFINDWMFDPQAPRDHHPLHWGDGAALRLPRVPVDLRAARPAAGALGRASQGAEAPLPGVRHSLHPPIQSGELRWKVCPRLRDIYCHATSGPIYLPCLYSVSVSLSRTKSLSFHILQGLSSIKDGPFPGIYVTLVSGPPTTTTTTTSTIKC